MKHLNPRSLHGPKTMKMCCWGGLVASLLAAGCQNKPPFSPTSLPAHLDQLRLVRVDQLTFHAHHVQGLIVTDDAYLVSGVDTKNDRAWLYRVDRKTMAKLAEADITAGAMIHPGGMSADGETFWVPVAEYDRDGPSLIQQRDIKSLKLIRQFKVGDHIGATAPRDGLIYGANWDAKLLYTWSPDGRQIAKTKNRNKGRYQDFSRHGHYLVAGGLLGGKGVIDWIDPKTLTLTRRITTGKTPDGHLYTREGISLWRNELYLMPEDRRSKIYVFQLSPKTSETQ